MQSSLFELPAIDPEPQAQCPHPPERQFLAGNLFTGNQDLTCSDCGATLAPDYQLSTETGGTNV